MSVNDLVNRLHSLPKNEPFDFKEIRDAIHYEADQPCTTEERVTLLRLFNAVLDRVERELSGSEPDKLVALKNVRLGDYRLLLIKEAMIGENICADTLYEITERENAAGRMTPDDGLRETAAPEMIAIAERGKAKKRGLWGRLFHGPTSKRVGG